MNKITTKEVDTNYMELYLEKCTSYKENQNKMNNKSFIITFALISQIVLFNFANASCRTTGANEQVINGNKYCVVYMTLVDNPGCGAPQGEFTLLDSSGMPSLSAVPACLFDPGTCKPIQFNGKTITPQTNTKTGYCSVQGFGKGKCIAPYNWTSTGCDISPQVAPTCPANTKFVRGYNGNYGCFKQMWKCQIGTFFMFDAKTRGTCLVD